MDVIAASDAEIVRRGLVSALRAAAVDVVAVARDPAELAALAHRLRPDVVVAAFRSPGAALRGRRVFDDVPVLVVAATTRRRDMVDAIRAGAHGYATLDIHPARLAAALETIAAGRVVLPDGWQHELLTALNEPAPPTRRRDGDGAVLTPREAEIIRLVLANDANKEIARRLDLATQTVKNHLHHVMAKVNVTSRRQLCEWAIANGYSPATLGRANQAA